MLHKTMTHGIECHNMENIDVSRREVLARVGAAGIGALAVGTGTAAADRKNEYNIGIASPAAERATRSAADQVVRTLDWDDEKTITGTFSDEAIDNLQNRPGIRYTEENGNLHAIAQTLPWGIDRVDAEVAHADGETGGDNTDGEGGADIAIIDTGIDSDHDDLQANLGKGKAFVECKGSPHMCGQKWDDDNGHGTHVAGIAGADDNSLGVVGVSTAATLHAVKVLDSNGSGSYSDVAAGIKYVADQGWDVGNLSLGGSRSSTVADAVQYADKNGVFLAAAAGNSGPCTDCVGYPAAEPECVAVSATTKNDSLADFSSTGPEVELAAPGKGIYSTYPGDDYNTLSGTSMASPHVAGAAGQLMDNGYTHQEARTQLNSTAEDIGLSSNEQGNGLLDVEAALGTAELGVDSLSATEVETSNGDAEFDVSWSVSDPDSNLDTVDFVLQDTTAGSQDDSVTVSVSGDSASGTTRLVASGDENSGHSYDVTATVTDGDGNTASKTVSTSETEDMPAVDSLSLTEVETSDSDAEFDVDWAVSDADSDLHTLDLTLYELDSDSNRVETEDSASPSVSGGSVSGTTRLVASGDDGSGNTYEVEAVVSDTDGTTTSDTATATESEETESAPTIDTFTLSSGSPNNPHAEVTVDWAVSDTNSNLDTVEVIVDDADESETFSNTTDVSGGSASGTDEFTDKFDSGEYGVTLTVTDTAGNSTTDSKSITA